MTRTLPMAARTRRDWQQWASKGTTAQRGYGSKHQAERERRLAEYKPGDICAHGGEVMFWAPSAARGKLDLPHNATRTGYLPGLSCAFHNRQDGGRRRAAMRRKAQPWQSARSW